MQLFLLIFTYFLIFRPIRMVDLEAQLEMCNFLSENAVFASEQHNVVGQVGSLFRDGIPYETHRVWYCKNIKKVFLSILRLKQFCFI